ncbi:sulfur oxidation protein SoxZ [Variibacter gotjawalensis]|uniref:Sulfur oxidation protein SoxZ n=1 Tax=Variibacter gotjawalensis TaxID=1333996 RepID=A0A0S3PTB6_9BRAD|nr:thiosulfate oxidation carrier complex protein SoxZ [Variibacter gotjawalensis]NIK49480.1 sulfur-oxidizing protein SoxZ [Variibacter gotjawalensis]RZS51332.1 sulfur compound chelating protein SoxZ [Variibacter gotjawalensis]BAT59165.1 sulfur oxidation protein SoxZ [Variibacter gotjawalensis]
MSDAKPRPRVRLDKKEVKKGETIELKTLIQHTMESGQRKDASGNTIPRKIIKQFTAELNGKTVFSCDLEPAISANPYMQFRIRPDASGTLKLTWLDDDGSKIEHSEEIKVV